MAAYFRSVGEPAQCKLARSGEIYIGPVERCPCGNARCNSVVQAASWWEYTRQRHGKTLIFGAAAVAAVIVLLLGSVLLRKDPMLQEVEGLRNTVVSLQTRLGALESAPTTPRQDPQALAGELAARAKELETRVRSQVQAGKVDDARVSLASLEALLTHFDATVNGATAPPADSGAQTAQVQQLLGEWQSAQDTAENLQQRAQGKPKVSEPVDQTLEEIRAAQGRTRQLMPRKGPAPSAPKLAQMKSTVTASLNNARAAVAQYVPPPEAPFAPEEATLAIATTSDLAENLVVPMLQARGQGKVTALPGQKWYYTSPPGARSDERVLVQAAPEHAVARLVDGKADLLIADVPYTPEEIQAFEAKFPQHSLASRAQSEVVALDALTLLGHPEGDGHVVAPAEMSSIAWISGPPGSPEHAAAMRFGFQLGRAAEDPAQAVLANPAAHALGLYHKEQGNVRARRLAFQPGPKVVPLKPSPFTIATEDYKFSFRIVASNSPASRPAALELVHYMTSAAGQRLVSQRGYVDLTLRPAGGDVDPRILAVLGQTLHLKDVRSATRISTNFRFALNDARLDLKASADLERLPEEIARDFPRGHVVILGFTDSSGSPGVNMPLSIQRAQGVASELAKAKMNVAAAGMGDQLPIDDDSRPEGAARNRRAEVWVVP